MELNASSFSTNSPRTRVGNVLIFEKNDRFVEKTSRKIEKRSFKKTIVFQNDRFYKVRRFVNDR